jgi:hypothetical protein
LVNQILVESNRKEGIAPNDAFLRKQLEILVQQQIFI